MKSFKEFVSTISSFSLPYCLIAFQTFPKNDDYGNDEHLRQRGQDLEEFISELRKKIPTLKSYRTLWEQCVVVIEAESADEIGKRIKEIFCEKSFSTTEFRIIVSKVINSQTMASLEPIFTEITSKQGFTNKRSHLNVLRMINSQTII